MLNKWKLEYLGFGKYQRLKLASDKINTTGKDLLIGDIGGGDGCLCLFLPNHRYILVDSSTNGIDGINLPFENKFFDICVSCDTLEHLPKQQRQKFISQMIRVSREKVYLIAPFGEKARELELFYHELTKDPWTKQHLKYNFSTLKEMEDFLKDKNLSYEISPCSFIPTHFVIGYLNNYLLIDKPELFKKINHFFNLTYCDINRIEPSYGHLIDITIK